MRFLLTPLLLSYARTVLGVPFVKDAIKVVIFATTRDDDTPEVGSAEFWYHIVISIFLVLAGGVFAG